MQQYYQPLYQQARNLQYRVHDVMDNPNHPMAQVLRTEVQHLNDELQAEKNPRDIEDRIKVIQHTLMETQNSADHIMNVDHSAGLHHDYERMRFDVRRMPHY